MVNIKIGNKQVADYVVLEKKGYKAQTVYPVISQRMHPFGGFFFIVLKV